MDKIVFYVGVIPEDIEKVQNHLLNFNNSQPEVVAEVKGNFDDPYGYYEFAIEGNWDSYKSFLGLPFVRSLNHYEE